MKYRQYALIALLGLTATANADDNAKIKAAQEKLQATFSNLTISDFSPSVIPGMYEVVGSGKVIYFYPEKELIVFGEIYDKEGHSLTQEKLQQVAMKNIEKVPLASALKIGNGPKKVIEFTDPDCPYCQRFHAYSKKVAKDITRYVFFSPIEAIHPNAGQKAVHVLCSPDPEAALDELFSGNKPVPAELLRNCPEGRAKLKVHTTVSTQFGVNGTPTLVIDNSVVTGFQQERIAQLISAN